MNHIQWGEAWKIDRKNLNYDLSIHYLYFKCIHLHFIQSIYQHRGKVNAVHKIELLLMGLSSSCPSCQQATCLQRAQAGTSEHYGLGLLPFVLINFMKVASKTIQN